MYQIADVCMLLFLAIAARCDIKTKEITCGYLFTGVISVMIYQIFWGKPALPTFLMGIITGFVFLGLSKLTEEGIGYGDSLMILILGGFLGVWKLMLVLVIAFSSVSLVSAIGLRLGKLSRSSKIAFYPYLLAGYVGALLCG